MSEHGQADRIVEDLEGILVATRERGGHGPGLLKLMDDSSEILGALRGKLLELQSFITLEETSETDDEMNRARAFWETLPADSKIGDTSGIVSLSPTLGALNRAAVTIESMHRFGDDRVRLAAKIGQQMARYPQYVSAIAQTGSKYPTFTINTGAVGRVTSLLKELTRIEAISGFVLEGLVEQKEGPDFWRPDDKLKPGQKPTKWRVKRGTVSPAYRDFLGGHWLAAYAYGIAKDQFVRTGEPFEIYSNVTYTLPGDLAGGKSDIDVLVRTSDVVLCIECKSGRVLTSYQNGPTAAAKTVRDAARFDKALDQMGVDLTRHYQLVFFETQEETVTDVAAALKGKVRAVTPADVRAIIQRVASGAEVGLDPAGAPNTWTGTWLKVTSSGGILELDVQAEGKLVERSHFDADSPTSEGTWSATAEAFTTVVDGWTSVFPIGGDVLQGAETHADGDQGQVTIARLDR